MSPTQSTQHSLPVDVLRAASELYILAVVGFFFLAAPLYSALTKIHLSGVRPLKTCATAKYSFDYELIQQLNSISTFSSRIPRLTVYKVVATYFYTISRAQGQHFFAK